MRVSRRYRLFAVLAAAVLAGCSGAGVTGPACPPQPALIGTVGALVSPPNHATGVSTTIGTLTFTLSDPTLQSATLSLSPAGVPASVRGGPITASGGNYSSTIPALQSGLTYQVGIFTTVPLAGYPGCTVNRGGVVGEFTTQ